MYFRSLIKYLFGLENQNVILWHSFCISNFNKLNKTNHNYSSIKIIMITAQREFSIFYGN